MIKVSEKFPGSYNEETPGLYIFPSRYSPSPALNLFPLAVFLPVQLLPDHLPITVSYFNGLPWELQGISIIELPMLKNLDRVDYMGNSLR